MSEIINTPDCIVPFAITIDEVEKKISDIIISGDYIPQDIFEYLSFDDIRPIYLPMFLYEGRYYVDWDCELAREEKYLGADSEGRAKEKRRTVYYPYNGTTKESFAILALAYQGDELRPELAAFAQKFPYEAAMAKPFDLKYLSHYKNLITLKSNQDKESIWRHNAVDAINRAANSKVKELLSNKRYKNLKSNLVFEGQRESLLAFIPFWLLRFEYQGAQYHIIMDGLGKGINHLLPIDKATQRKSRKLRNQTRLALCGAIALSISLFFVNFDFQAWSSIRWTLVALAAGGYLALLFINSRKIKAIIKTARAERRKGGELMINVDND